MRHLSTGSLSIVRLHRGDALVESLEAAMKEAYTQSAVVQFGIGSLASVEFGVLPPEGPHERHTLAGPVEMVYLSGLVVGKSSSGPYGSHLHVAVATRDGAVKGGHLFKAKVGLAAEVGLLPVRDARMKRVRDEKTQLDLLEF